MEKKDYSADTRQRMAREGLAMRDGSFPVANETDLRNAIQSVGRAADYEAARRHVIRRARALGLTQLLPEDWNVSKALWQGSFVGPLDIKSGPVDYKI